MMRFSINKCFWEINELLELIEEEQYKRRVYKGRYKYQLYFYISGTNKKTNIWKTSSYLEINLAKRKFSTQKTTKEI